MVKSEHAAGSVYAAVAAVAYGLNPLGGLIMYGEGFNTTSVLFYRFLFASLIFAGMLIFTRISFKVTAHELKILAVLGLLFCVSAIAWFTSFRFMDAGLASTLFFIYPVFVALGLTFIFHEKFTITILIAILFTAGGLGFLSRNEGGGMSVVGVSCVLLSAVAYTAYMIIINKSNVKMSALKMNFYMGVFCLLGVAAYSFVDPENYIMPLNSPVGLMGALFLAIVTTVLSLTCMVKAINLIGSTPTSIIGALEPLTAVTVGVLLFDESFTLSMACGIGLVLTGVLILIGGSDLKNRVEHLVARGPKLWRWRS